jgi:O-Antigen ligase
VTSATLAAGAPDTDGRPATIARAVRSAAGRRLPLAATLAAVLAGMAGMEAMLSGRVSVTGVAGALAAAIVVGLSAWRPEIGCWLLAAAIPLTVGLERNTFVPVLRPSEAITVLVAAGVLVHDLPTRRRRRYSGLDIAVLAYVAAGVIVPSLVLYAGHTSLDLATLRTVVSPLQYLVVYLVFSRARLSPSAVRVTLALALAVSALVAVIGVAQLADVPGVRSFLAANYPLSGTDNSICQYGVCRPTSVLSHWSSFGAYSVLGYTLALGLSATRYHRLPRLWLAAVMILDAIAVFASGTQAAVAGLALATVVVAVCARRVPRQVVLVGLALAAGVALLWPQISPRVEQQLGGQGVQTPESLAVRETYWSQLFLPVLEPHLLVGTGTVIPPQVPPKRAAFVDNEYLVMAFRAGVIGLAALLLMYASVAALAWRNRATADPEVRAVATVAVAYVAALAVMGMTAEYLTYGGVAQSFWMVVALLAASRLTPAGVAAVRR